jgi:non-heme chloroperoxidase
MPAITTNDGTQIYYKDWGSGQPIVFGHEWPLSADAREDQMFFLASRGYRCIANDRRGHGRWSQPWHGNAVYTYADEPAAFVETIFDDVRADVMADRAQLCMDLGPMFHAHNRPEAKVSEGVHRSFYLQGMTCGFPGACFCTKAFSETDHTEGLKNMDMPTLFLHGDDDQIVPLANSAKLAVELVQEETLKVYRGAPPHGMCTTHKEYVNEDPLSFIKG